MFDSVDDLNNVAWFLMGDFPRLSPWGSGLGLLREFLTCFVAYCESCA